MKDEKIKVLIADYDQQFAQELSDYLQKVKDIELMGAVADGTEALNFILSEKPDIVLLSTVMPSLDGLGVLEKFYKSSFDKKPAFIMTSTFCNDRVLKLAFDLGIEYFILKPLNLDILVQRVRDASNQKFNDYYFTSRPAKPSVLSISSATTTEEKVTEFIRQVGVPAHILGYQYLRDAIVLAAKDKEIIHQITTRLYPLVAESYNTTPSRVERAIRHAIETACIRGRVESIGFAYKGNGKDKPTNAEFIATVAEKFRLEK